MPSPTPLRNALAIAALFAGASCSSPLDDATTTGSSRGVLGTAADETTHPTEVVAVMDDATATGSGPDVLGSAADEPTHPTQVVAVMVDGSDHDDVSATTLYSLPAMKPDRGDIVSSAVYALDGTELWQPTRGMEVKSISCAEGGGFWAHVREGSPLRSWLYRVSADGEEASAEQVFDASGGSINATAGFEVTRCGAHVLYATPSVSRASGGVLPSRIQSVDGGFRWVAPEGADVQGLACDDEGGVVAHVMAYGPVRTWLYHIAPSGKQRSVEEVFDSSTGSVNATAGADVARCGAQLLFTVPALLDGASRSVVPSSVRSSDGTVAWDVPNGGDVRAIACRSGGGFTAHVVRQAPLRSWLFEVEADGSQRSAFSVFDSSSGSVDLAGGFDLASCE
jgi:hypothetical protein